MNTIQIDRLTDDEPSLGARLLGSGLVDAARAMFDGGRPGMPRPRIDETLLLNDQAPSHDGAPVEILTADRILHPNGR